MIGIIFSWNFVPRTMKFPVPDFVAEVLSESTADIDRTTKLKLFARFAVQEYWIIDPENATAEVYRREKNSFDLVLNLKASESLSSPLFPGFALPLRKLVE